MTLEKVFFNNFIPALIVLAILSMLVGASGWYAIDTPSRKEHRKEKALWEREKASYIAYQDSTDKVIENLHKEYDALLDSLILIDEKTNEDIDSLTDLDLDAKLKHLQESGFFD